MSKWILSLCLLLMVRVGASAQQAIPMAPHQMAEQMLIGVKNQDDVSGYITALANLSEEALQVGLASDAEKKAFWINVYNAFIQYKLQQDTAQFANRRKFFGKKDIVIAGKALSFDLIEHGILRRSKVKWAAGYMQKWFPSAFEKTQRVDSLDSRIHFALNQGAMSSPAVQFYQYTQINEQLDQAADLFMMFEINYDSSANSLSLPVLFRRYRGDFGGKKGVYTLLEQEGIIPADSQPKLVYTKYDWSLSVANFR